MQAILTAIRCSIIALYVCIFTSSQFAIIDLVSLPLLVCCIFRIPTLFYCHFPDKLLAKSLNHQHVSNIVRKMYRNFIDCMEHFSLRHASSICCNSKFTANAFKTVYPKLKTPSVIYPCINIPSPTITKQQEETPFFLSLNRYEAKKNIQLSIRSFSKLVHQNNDIPCKLIIAGGYDSRLSENVNVLNQLKILAKQLNLQSQVQFMCNVNDETRQMMLTNAIGVIYTPSEEHFGIVPLEAMSVRTPVVAVNSGGPCESIIHEETGFLCNENDEDDFANAMMLLLNDDDGLRMKMGEKGRQRVMNSFSRGALGEQLDRILQNHKK